VLIHLYGMSEDRYPSLKRPFQSNFFSMLLAAMKRSSAQDKDSGGNIADITKILKKTQKNFINGILFDSDFLRK
jgi:hypothetical protein